MQPMPTTGKHNVTPIAREVMNLTLDGAEARGIQSYGTTLQTHNGRDAYQDALEELVDAIQYVTQARMEKDDLTARIRELKEENTKLRYENTDATRERAEAIQDAELEVDLRRKALATLDAKEKIQRATEEYCAELENRVTRAYQLGLKRGYRKRLSETRYTYKKHWTEQL